MYQIVITTNKPKRTTLRRFANILEDVESGIFAYYDNTHQKANAQTTDTLVLGMFETREEATTYLALMMMNAKPFEWQIDEKIDIDIQEDQSYKRTFLFVNL